jgi:CxxC motif-containing protein (DUF1111 family)
MRVARITLGSLLLILLVGCRSPDSAVTDPPSPDSLTGPVFHLGAVSGTALGEPLAGLTADELATFQAGKDEFSEQEDVAGGLGPVFNSAACVDCHDEPVGGTTGRRETRFGRVENGVFDPLAHLGGSLIQSDGIGDVGTGFTFVGEVIPPEANVSTRRLTTQLFGLGLVDAVPDAEFVRLARLQATFTPSTAGTVQRVTEIVTGNTRVGKFGWKAQVPTLFQFSADAYLNEMGVTSPQFPNESCPQGDCSLLAFNPVPALNDDGEDVDLFNDFMTLLGPPPRAPRTPQTIQGGVVFTVIGCANCHTPVLVTGPSEVAALDRKVFQPFSDFLLHDMGSLGDGIEQGIATGRQMRTAPLWGANSRASFLHHGNAPTVEAAILEHDGQGRAARDRFTGLSDRHKAALIAFVNSI